MPATKSKGPGTLLLAIVLLLAVAGGSAWFIHSVLSGQNPLAGDASGPAGGATPTPADGPLKSVTLPGSAPGTALPGGQNSPQPGTQAGAQPIVPVVPGQTGTPPGAASGVVPLSPAGAGAAPGGQAGSAAGEDTPRDLLLVPGVIAAPSQTSREDAVVRPAFVSDIAAFLAQNYWPRNTHPSARRAGITTVSLRWANLRYGAELQGLEGRGSDPAKARSAVLGYVLQPGTVSRLYSLYADDFVGALAAEANRRVLGEGEARRALATAEKKELFDIYASYAARVSAALGRYAADASISRKVVAYANAEQAVQETNRIYMESSIAYEDAQENGGKSAAEAARLRRDKDAATYQKRIRERETLREALVAAMSRDKNAQDSGGDTLVYVAFWAYRRGPDSGPALQACAKALADMSAKLADAAGKVN
jgi:hypothetical protein